MNIDPFLFYSSIILIFVYFIKVNIDNKVLKLQKEVLEIHLKTKDQIIYILRNVNPYRKTGVEEFAERYNNFVNN